MGSKKKQGQKTLLILSAAAAAVILLGSLTVYGVSKMQQNKTAEESGTETVQDTETHDKPYFQIQEVMPTGVRVKIFNPTDEKVSFRYAFAVLRGDDVLPVTTEEGVIPVTTLESLQPERLVLTFPEQLPKGSYRLANLDEAGKVTDIFEHTEIEVSDRYDSMIYVPDPTGKDFDEVNAFLTEKGIAVQKCDSKPSGVHTVGEVVKMEKITDEYVTDEAGVAHSLFTGEGWDGKGYWMSPGDRVTLHVYSEMILTDTEQQ